MEKLFNNATGMAKHLFGNQNSLYVAQYGWQQYLGDDTYTFGYIASYKEAADILVEQKQPDLLLFPIVFCYRQYLELLLKNIYHKNKTSKEYIDFIKRSSHNLEKIWKDVKCFINLSSEDLDAMEELVLVFNQLDPSSMNFRYEFGKDQTRLLSNPITIDTYIMKRFIDAIDDQLRYTYDTP